MNEPATPENPGLATRRRVGAAAGFALTGLAAYLGAQEQPQRWFTTVCTAVFLLLAILGGLRAEGKRRRLFDVAVAAAVAAALLDVFAAGASRARWTAVYATAGVTGLIFMTSHFRWKHWQRWLLKFGGNLLFFGALVGLGLWIQPHFASLGWPFLAAAVPPLLIVAAGWPAMLDDPKTTRTTPSTPLDVTKADHLMPLAHAALKAIEDEDPNLPDELGKWAAAHGADVPRPVRLELLADFLVHEQPELAVKLAGGQDLPVLSEIARQAEDALGDEVRGKPVLSVLGAFGLALPISKPELLKSLVVCPSLAARLAEHLGIAVPFALAQQAELDEIRISRDLRSMDEPPDRVAAGQSEKTFHDRLANSPGALEGRYAPRQAFELGLMGLAFSGGGIRSATFNLGVLQALAEMRLLPRVDYLSTVSGGGYIGSWFVSWVKRLQGGVRSVQLRLSSRTSPDPNAPATRPIRFLREYSNYLTPQPGLLGADTWTLVAIWLRNTVLVQSVLVLSLSALLLLPINIGILARLMEEWSLSVKWLMGAFGLWAFFILCLRTGKELSRFVKADAERVGALDETWAPRDTAGLSAVQGTIVAPAFGCTLLLGVCLWAWAGEGTALPAWLGGTGPAHLVRTALFATVLFVVGLLIVEVRAGYARVLIHVAGARKRAVALAVVFLATIGPAIVAGAMTMGVLALYGVWLKDQAYWHVVALGPPMMAAIVGSLLVHHVGLLGRGFDDDRREWLSRLTAWLFIWCAGWLVLFGFAIYSPAVVGWAGRRVAAAGGVAWLASAAWGAYLGRSGSTKGKAAAAGERMEGLKNVVTLIAPYVFVVGLLVAISVALHALIAAWHGSSLVAALASRSAYWDYLGQIDLLKAAGLMVFFTAVAVMLAWRVDVNEFSMHHLYKNRLVRCYLGASREGSIHPRHPHPFTGFDRDDDVRLATLRTDPGLAVGTEPDEHQQDSEASDEKTPYRGPLPVVCTALNLVKGDDLAWQERKAQSFVFTPLFSGFEHLPTGRRATKPAPALKDDGLRPTGSYAYPTGGVRLGTAMAISGAAANPNMGYHSSPATAFLMTMFNVRLGWWMGNPRHEKKWRQSSPTLGLSCLLDELTGNTANHSRFVNLSDGGHFENLGVYELVRRRCRFILACDAEQDGGFTFAGLGSVVRKCRTDFGVQIQFPCGSIVFQGVDRFKKVHFALGQIFYPGAAVPGQLLYVKSSLSEDETSDLLEYSRRVAKFPHESTADQWFDESQFESYRQLGQAIIHRVLGTDAASQADAPDCWTNIFAGLPSFVPPPPPERAESQAGERRRRPRKEPAGRGRTQATTAVEDELAPPPGKPGQPKRKAE